MKMKQVSELIIDGPEYHVIYFHGLNHSLYGQQRERNVRDNCVRQVKNTTYQYCDLTEIWNKGSFTYDVITEGEAGFQMITFDYEGGGGFWLMIA